MFYFPAAIKYVHVTSTHINELDERRTLLDNLQSTEENIHDKNDSQISELLPFGVSSNNDASNTCVLNATIQYILATKILDVPLTNLSVV